MLTRWFIGVLAACAVVAPSTLLPVVSNPSRACAAPPSARKSDPDRRRREVEERYQELLREGGSRARLSRGWTRIPDKADKGRWFVAFSVVDYAVLHSRSSVSWRVRAVKTASSKFNYRRLVVIIRFRELVPTVAVSRADKSWYESNTRKVRKGKSTYYVVPKAKLSTAYFRKDSEGAWSAKITTGKATWSVHEQTYQIEAALLP